MKTRLLIFAFVGFTLLITSIPDSESLRAVLELDEMIKSSDIIVIGTVQSTWLDIRPFNEHKIVDTAEIKVDEWLKNDKNSDTLEIRYYGYWAKTIENLVGIHRMDTPTHKYETGQKVLILANYESPDMVMGEGYYPFYEGSFVINDDVTTSQTGEQSTLHQLNTVINNVVNDEIAQLDCFLTEYWDGTKCVPLDFETSVDPEQFQPHPGLGMLNQAERKCEAMGGTWNVNHCLITQEIIDSNQLTCDPGPVLESGTCKSNGVKLVFESAVEPKPES